MSLVLTFENKKHLSSDVIMENLSRINPSIEIESNDSDCLQLYLPKVSTRGVFILFEEEEEEVQLKINLLSSFEDYSLFSKCACELTSLLDTKALDEDDEYLDKESIKAKFNDDRIKKIMQNDAGMIYALISSKKDSVIEIDSIVRRVAIGDWTIKNIGCKSPDNSEELSECLIRAIKRMQYDIPAGIGTNCLCIRFNDHKPACLQSKGDMVEASVYKWNESQYFGVGEYVLIYCEPFIESEWEYIAVPSKKLGSICPKKWERLDEVHFIPSDITEKEYSDFWKKALKFAEKKYSLPKDKLKSSGKKKIYLCSADSDLRISYNLAVLLEENGYEVLPSSKELDKGPAKSKVKETSLEECDIVVIVHTWSSGLSKKYVKDIDNIIKQEKPIISISLTREDYESIDPQKLDQNEFMVNSKMNIKFTNLLSDIKEMNDWLDYLDEDEEPYRQTEVDKKYYEEAMKYSDSDPEKEFKLLEEGAIKGGANCQFMTGWCYNNGNGVKTDEKKSFEWCLKAAKQNQLQALNSIGRHYWDGELCEQDAELALKYLKKALKFGLSCAGYGIGGMYEEADIVEQNYGKALYWYLFTSDEEEINRMIDKLTEAD